MGMRIEMGIGIRNEIPIEIWLRIWVGVEIMISIGNIMRFGWRLGSSRGSRCRWGL